MFIAPNKIHTRDVTLLLISRVTRSICSRDFSSVFWHIAVLTVVAAVVVVVVVDVAFRRIACGFTASSSQLTTLGLSWFLRGKKKRMKKRRETSLAIKYLTHAPPVFFPSSNRFFFPLSCGRRFPGSACLTS